MRTFKVTVNGNQYDVTVEELGAPAAAPVALQPAPAPVPVQAPAAQPVPAPAAQPAPVQAAPAPAAQPQPAPAAQPAAKAAPAGGVQITAPMPGMVVDFKVAEGATVKKGEAILILEAMKMENDIASTADGVISFVTTKGANVNTGDLLAVVK